MPPSRQRPRRVGWLQGGAPDPLDEQQKVNDALAEVGWIVGQNVLIDRRYVSFDDLPRAAEGFVNAKVDLIIANGTPATLAAKKATSSDTTRIAKFDDLLAELVRRRAQALNFSEDALPVNWIPQILDAAVRVSLPTIVDTYRWLEAGALLCYEEDERELLHRDAVLFDKLLRGVNPADLPVEQPTKFSLGINMKTAKAIGIAIPQSLLLRADRLIQ
jgi:ABC-type uncharacterized transport system substrate-binding protein